MTVVPLFILMGAFVTRAGLSEELYTASNAFVGHWRGGLAMATIVACGGFSAVCGSSLATAATMSRVAMPSMRRYHLADSLATGALGPKRVGEGKDVAVRLDSGGCPTIKK